MFKEATVTASGKAKGGIPLWQLRERAHFYGQEIAKDRIDYYRAVVEAHSFLNSGEDAKESYFKQEFSRVFDVVYPRKRFTKIFKQLKGYGTGNG